MALPIKDIKKLVAIMEKSGLTSLTCGEIHLERPLTQKLPAVKSATTMSANEAVPNLEIEPDELERLLYNIGTELHG